MNIFFKNLRDILEIIYFISGPVLVFVSFKALKQIKIAKDEIAVMKNGIKTSSLRETVKFTAEQCKIFSEEIIPQNTVYRASLKNKSCEAYNGGTNNFRFDGETKAWFDNNGAIICNVDAAISDKIYEKAINLANALEAFSIYFIHGICDEKIAYVPISPTFIDMVTRLSPFIAYNKAFNESFYSNLLELYNLWIERKKNDDIKKQANKKMEEYIIANEQAAAIKEKNIKRPIGTE